MSKVTFKGFITVPEKDLSVVKETLINHRNLTQNESGCLVFEVTQSCHLLYMEPHKNYHFRPTVLPALGSEKVEVRN